MNQQHDCGQENQDGEHSAPTRPAEQPLGLGPRVGGQILVLVAHEGPCEADGLYIGGGRQVAQDLQAFVELPEQPFIAGDDLRRDYQERGVGSQGRPRGGAGQRSVSGRWDGQDRCLVPVREVPEELAEVALQAPHPEDGIRFGRQVGRAVVHDKAGHSSESAGRSGALIAARRLTVRVPPISSDARRPPSAFRPQRLPVADMAENRQGTASRQPSTPHPSGGSASGEPPRQLDAHINMVNKLSIRRTTQFSHETVA